MSGQQWGTVIGGAIGAYFGGPQGAQLGMAIGGAIGGAIDPERINGPAIGDGQTQRATDGAPIAWVMGTATVAGTLIQVGPRRSQKVKDSGGKGGGPVVSHNEAHQDFAILVCESSQLKDSFMDAIIMVEQDGKIVYDMRPESTMKQDSAKWAQNVTFHYGEEWQQADPTLEAITGLGTTPTYRGSLTVVFRDFNLSKVGDRIPSFRFTVTSAGIGIMSATATWKYAIFDPVGGPYTTPTGITTDDYNDDSWSVGAMPFGHIAGTSSGQGVANAAHSYYENFPALINTQVPLNTRTWLRKKITIPELPTEDVAFFGYFDNGFKMWVNGNLVVNRSVSTNGGFAVALSPSIFRIGSNTIVCACDDQTTIDSTNFNSSYFCLEMPGVQGTLGLDEIVSRICKRGGLEESDFDVTDLYGIPVVGYPIARQCSAVDALMPLLQAYFCYPAEYDGKIWFKRYGANAVLTVNDEDLVEDRDANDNNAVSTRRNAATQFPQKVTVSYFDPAQNYMPVTVSERRTAADIIAIGEQLMSVPVVMPADQAKQAAQKAMKIAYATLEGTQEYALPFARNAVYLTLCPGDPIIFRGKRWVIDKAVLGDGSIKLSTRYDRQSAYTSNVQAIKGNPPIPPTSPYSGPTTLIAMNLPSLRPQDTYGLYLAAGPADGQTSWRGCTVQISYDEQETWVNATQITQPSVFGEVVNGDPLTVDVNDDLLTVTDAQIAARANAFAIIHSTGDEIGQFKTATEDESTQHRYVLTDVTRAGLGTTEVAATAGEQFVMLDAVYFVPISTDFTGKMIYLRGVGFGEAAEDAEIVSIEYNPDTTVILDGNG